MFENITKLQNREKKLTGRQRGSYITVKLYVEMFVDALAGITEVPVGCLDDTFLLVVTLHLHVRRNVGDTVVARHGSDTFVRT